MKAIFATLVVVLAFDVESSADVVIDTVPVGNAGGGGVSYNYNIGKYEVTNAQYTEFLNAVDPSGTDTLALYSINMSNHANGGGINFSGDAADEAKYTVEAGRDNNPVNNVSWYDAVRFTNWLHNSQGDVSTETGAYTLRGGTAQPANGSNVTRNVGATWFLPNVNEWHKAAYHKNDGVTENYWRYPTSTDVEPYSDQPPGSDAPTQSNTANFTKDDGLANGYDDGQAVSGMQTSGFQNFLTDVGAYTLSTSPYGTYDQGGNVYEWAEDRFRTSDASINRHLRGGSSFSTLPELNSSFSGTQVPTLESNSRGFRVASVSEAIPEPSTSLLAAFGALGLFGLRRHR